MSTHHAFVPQAAPTGSGVTYSEVRDWAVWLNLFTAEHLADSMGVDTSIGERAIRALLWHGICEDTGSWINGYPLIQYKPLPPGPNDHYTYPPEWRTCEMEIIEPRGMPIRIRSDRDTRRKMAGDMSARRRLKLQEERYQAMVRAQQERAEKQKSKLPKWMRGR